METVLKQMHEEAKRPSERALGIPVWLDEVILRCLKKDPNDRFESMDDLLNEVNSNTCSIASAVEIGSIAKQARQKNLNLENSRNARTLRGPGAFTALFQTALPPPPSRPGDRTGVLKSPPPRAPSVPGGITAMINALNEPTLAPIPPGTEPHLLYGEPSQAQSSRALTESGPTRIGSALDNDIVLEKEDVSRYHAQIESLEGIFLLVDLNSSKGTYLNGERVLRPQQLSPNDRFRISTTLFNLIA